MSDLWITFLVALVVSLLVTPFSIKLAPKIGAVDIPNDNRRMHKHAMPRFGGLAIFAGSTIAMLMFWNFDNRINTILAGGACIYVLGIIDDLKSLSAKIKIAGELLVAILMYIGDIRIEFLSNYFGEGNHQLGSALCFIVTIAWIVGITNTVNLIDGLDGLAAGTSAIASLCIAYAAYIHGTYVVSGAMLALAGAALGFLPFNFYPAKIFMGDGGSLYLGFMLAALSVLGTVKSATLVAVIIPVLVLGVPIFDTAFAIFRRFVNNKPIMEADKGHLHHRLMNLGYGQRRATLMLYGITGIMGVAAVTFSRELYVETAGLSAITLMYIYIFLTDTEHIVPKIKSDDGNE
jgi:UDP-GlcNAc:undecaprenyl-phosphate GlcNAc-1-phosphate transferase